MERSRKVFGCNMNLNNVFPLQHGIVRCVYINTRLTSHEKKLIDIYTSLGKNNEPWIDVVLPLLYFLYGDVKSKMFRADC